MFTTSEPSRHRSTHWEAPSYIRVYRNVWVTWVIITSWMESHDYDSSNMTLTWHRCPCLTNSQNVKQASCSIISTAKLREPWWYSLRLKKAPFGDHPTVLTGWVALPLRNKLSVKSVECHLKERQECAKVSESEPKLTKIIHSFHTLCGYTLSGPLWTV